MLKSSKNAKNESGKNSSSDPEDFFLSFCLKGLVLGPNSKNISLKKWIFILDQGDHSSFY